MKTMKVVLMLLAIGLLVGSAQAAAIPVVAGHAYNESDGPLVDSYNGSGMTGPDTHRAWDEATWGPYEAWLTYRNPGVGPYGHGGDPEADPVVDPDPTAATGWAWACYDLGADYVIDTMEIWNLTGDAYGYYFADGGMQDVTIQYSSDDYTWSTLVTGRTLAKGPVDAGVDYLPGDTINFGGVTARYVLITSDTFQGPIDPGYTGLAEVRFTPEPMTLGVLALGAGSLVLLRRRRRR